MRTVVTGSAGPHGGVRTEARLLHGPSRGEISVGGPGGSPVRARGMVGWVDLAQYMVFYFFFLFSDFIFQS